MKTPEERTKDLLAKQLALQEKMKKEGKHIYQKKTIASSSHHIEEWLKPALKAIKRRNKKRASVINIQTAKKAQHG